MTDKVPLEVPSAWKKKVLPRRGTPKFPVPRLRRAAAVTTTPARISSIDPTMWPATVP